MGFSSPLRLVSQAAAGLVLLGALSSPSLCSQTAAHTTLVEPPAPLLPQSVRSGATDDAGNGVPSWAGPDAPVLTEDGIVRYERSTSKDGTITVYQFQDATGAVSAWDYLHKSAPYVIRSGVSVVVADLKLHAQEILRTIETGLPRIGGPRGLAPLLPTLLPAQNLQKDSVRYALGPAGYKAMDGVLPPDIVGFDKAAETATAKYQGRGTLTLLLYPTPEIAGAHGRQIEAEMNKEGSAAGTVKLRREGPLVLLTTGAWTPAQAEEIIHGIHLRNEVTWNKPMPPEFHAEVQKTYSLLTSIAIFCGLGALAAIVLGLFFGGGRAAIRVLQGKPAATEPEFLRIDLSGRAARIHTDGPETEPRS